VLFDKFTEAIIFHLLQAQNFYGLEEEKYWCGWRDLNPHASRRQNLNIVQVIVFKHFFGARWYLIRGCFVLIVETAVVPHLITTKETT
jgi:hypothetical protein